MVWSAWMLCDLPCKIVVGPCASPFVYKAIGCCVIIQVVVHWMLCDHPSRFRPLRSRGRIIQTSKVALFRVRLYEVSLDLSKPMTSGVGLCLSCGEIYTTSAEFPESIRIATSLEWATAGMRSQMIRLFM
jgi:hypothetical protein